VLIFVVAAPACAGVAAGAVSFADALLGDTVPYSCGKRGLVAGLMGIWGVVLFGFLMGQVDRLVTWIAPLRGLDPVKEGAPVPIGTYRDRHRATPRPRLRLSRTER
jgi:hypothetical protein